jgi:hypothetical protein
MGLYSDYNCVDGVLYWRMCHVIHLPKALYIEVFHMQDEGCGIRISTCAAMQWKSDQGQQELEGPCCWSTYLDLATVCV